jgi:hypothetical protein
MWNDLTDYFFWFIQPPTNLIQLDRIFIYVFLGFLVLAFVVRIAARFAVSNPITKKVLLKFWGLMFTVGFSGLIWGVMRYENTPIFARRYWAGLSFAIGIIWLLFIVKYLIFNYQSQKQDYQREEVKNKYLPASTRRRV